MNKKIKTLFKSISISSVIFVPLSVLSAETNTNNNGTSTPDKPAKPKEPKNDPEFGKFREIADKQLKEMIKSALDNLPSYIEDQISKVEKLETDYKKRLSKITYLKVVDKYFKKNKQKFIDDPVKNGLNLIFPWMISRNRNVNISKIKYNNKDYDSVWTGLSDPTDYVKPLGEGAQINPTEKNAINHFDKAKFESSLTEYAKALNEGFGKLVYDEKDVLELDKDFKLNFDDANSKESYNITPPKGFNNWDDYIISKIKPRVTDFDIELNIKLTKDEEQPQNQEQPKDEPQDEPLPEDDKAKDPVKTEEVSQGIPALAPELKWQYLNESNIVSLFSVKQDIFFFKNPVNTRYEYKVLEVKKEGDKYIAKVELHDLVNTQAKRTYSTEVYMHNKDQKNALLTERSYNVIKDIFSKLYRGLGIDENIDYEKLGSGILSDALFQIVNSSVQLISTEKFINNYNRVIEAYKDELKLDDIENSTSGFDANLRELVLSSLKTSNINNFPYYFSLVDALNRKKEGLKRRIINNKELAEEFEKNNWSLDELNKFYLNLETKIYKLRKSTDLSTFNVTKWYSRFIANLETVSKELLLLQVVVNDPSLKQPSKPTHTENPEQPNESEPRVNSAEATSSSTPTSNEIIELANKDEKRAEAYKKMTELNNESRKTNNSIVTNFGIALSLIGFLGNIVNAYALFKIINYAKWKQHKKLSILLATVFGIILVTGIILIILGLGGI
ncbi:MSC_0620 family F1-like ATPase-associated subunit [Mycoplasmopsis canis]|uniref:MSC_0620 family F1-like ATPase-associated subunit n=1 Tax=Mycoplasmopsis canis TaxID=29555 RepID=UPI00025AD002|nr:hypothetical protein [Mycoplasmopsis canis]EIE40201.1 hypothetical protein MCANUF33_01771 [Mycoplasmopsis canis UF33]